MTFDAGFTLVVVAITILAIAREVFSPDVLLFGALVVLMAAGILDPERALDGFSNPAVATVGALFIVAAGLRATGALEDVAHRILGRGTRLRGTIARLATGTVTLSAFVNNTPIVAMGIPAVTNWAKRHRVSPSRLLIPLSYASILGGVCTLIGTSTNLVSDGLLRAHGLAGLGFFELTAVGIPCALVGILYLTFFAPTMLEDRIPVGEHREGLRRYVVEMELGEPSPLIGRTIEEAGLRHLPGLFLVRIERRTGILSPVAPAERLFPGDRLTFAGVVETIVDLRSFRGLTPAASERPPEADTWELHEAVVSAGSPLVGASIRHANFRARYNAAVIAVHRHGERVDTRLGDIVLRPGDTLLLEAAPGFTRAYRDSTDFYLVSRVSRSAPPKRDLMLRSGLVLLGVVVLAVLGVPVVIAALGGGIATILLRCLSLGEARRTVDWSVLLMIGSALGIAAAMESTGAAALIGDGIVNAGAAFGPIGILAAVFIATMVLTELVSNTATAALMFPIALAAAATQGLDPRPFIIAITAAASLSLSTPLGYQTNLMVYGPGGYRFLDFTRVGLPLQLVLGVIAVAVIQLAWPLRPV
ncbi:MAG: SLC13 family permease [Gemmatimonadota bacterium]